MKLRAFGLADQVRAINLRGRARSRGGRGGARPTAYVAGAIGPLGVRIEPWGKTGVDEAEAIVPRAGAGAARRRRRPVHARDVPRPQRDRRGHRAPCAASATCPIVAQMTTEEDGNSLDGTPPEQFAPALSRARRRRRRRQLQRRARRRCSRRSSAWPSVTDVRLSAQPNAGKPRDIEGRNLYLCSPEYMASYARRFIASGVRLVGGCCGTTPEHIRQISAGGASRWRPGLAPARRRRRRVRTPGGRASPTPQPPVPREAEVAHRAASSPRRASSGASNWCRPAATRPRRRSPTRRGCRPAASTS